MSAQERPRVAALLLAAGLAGCAAGPRFDVQGVDGALTPARAVADAPDVRGHRVLWGGVIVSSTNLKTATRLEVLAHPLDRNQEPDTDGPPGRRFLILQEGYLETMDYAPGRRVTVLGSLGPPEDGRVGDAPYRYPVVDAVRLYLWPRARAATGPQVHFGIGLGFHN